MPLVSCFDTPAYVISSKSFISDNAKALAGMDFFESDAINSMVDEIRIGNVVYPLRKSLTATFIPGKGEFLVDGFSPIFVGHGDTQQRARRNFHDEVHMTFQDLIAKRPFEMSERERRDWVILNDQIDVTLYRNNTPIHVTQYGWVSKVRPYPVQVTWENGSKESISLEIVESPDFVTYKAGQPFEAVVARDPISFALLRIVHVERRARASRLTSEAEIELLASIGSSDNLEEVDW
jgi:hypothetical protein